MPNLVGQFLEPMGNNEREVEVVIVQREESGITNEVHSGPLNRSQMDQK